VYRLLNPLGFAAGQLAVFQQQSTKWCWMRLPRALPGANFERNDITTICETVHP